MISMVVGVHVCAAEDSAFSFVHNTYKDIETDGIPKLIELYGKHKDNCTVVGAICLLIGELAEYGR